MWTSGKNVEKKVSSSNICFGVSDKNEFLEKKKMEIYLTVQFGGKERKLS